MIHIVGLWAREGGSCPQIFLSMEQLWQSVVSLQMDG